MAEYKQSGIYEAFSTPRFATWRCRAACFKARVVAGSAILWILILSCAGSWFEARGMVRDHALK
jgi:hypothetical protein